MFCSISLATSHLFNIDSSQLSPKALRPFRCAISHIDFLRWQWQDKKEEKWSEHRSRATGSNRDWRKPHIVELQKGIRQAMQGDQCSEVVITEFMGRTARILPKKHNFLRASGC